MQTIARRLKEDRSTAIQHPMKGNRFRSLGEAMSHIGTSRFCTCPDALARAVHESDRYHFAAPVASRPLAGTITTARKRTAARREPLIER